MQPPPRGCVLKQMNGVTWLGDGNAAASARLCVETHRQCLAIRRECEQPPPRGCVLKRLLCDWIVNGSGQPPPRGCVLKPAPKYQYTKSKLQPPPRGCVLKRSHRLLAHIV